MDIPFKDLTLQHISQSYQGLVQQYSGYLVDGTGHAMYDLGPTGSIVPSVIINSSVTSSMTVASSSHASTADISYTASLAYIAQVAETASIAIISNVALNALSASYVDGNASSSSFSQIAATASYFSGSIETAIFANSASFSEVASTASYAPNHVKKSGDVLTGDIIGTDFVRTRSGTITRDGDGYITQVALTGGRTINVTRVDGYISSLNDGARTWNYNRDGDNQITSWEVITI